MRLRFHPRVAADISRIMSYYEEVGGQRLAEEFYAELRACFLRAGAEPESYAIRVRDLRRVNLERFPYDFEQSHHLAGHTVERALAQYRAG